MANTTTERNRARRPTATPPSPSPYPLTRPSTSAASARRRCSFLLRAQTLRNLVRIGTLLALDFGGLFAAIFTALMVKAVLRADTWAWHASYVEAKSLIAFAYLVTALLFARSGLYAERAAAPGPAEDRHLALPDHGRRAALRGGQRRAVLRATTSSTAR